jgi:hypothetical protein
LGEVEGEGENDKEGVGVVVGEDSIFWEFLSEGELVGDFLIEDGDGDTNVNVGLGVGGETKKVPGWALAVK